MGTLGYPDVGSALAARPAEMASVSPEQWDVLDELHAGGGFGAEFDAAWRNGQAFLAARDGLRGRRPIVVEWRGGARQPGDEPVPADLRIDHVFLVSCKYLSKIVANPSPATLFDRLLAGGHGGRSVDWYADVATDAYRRLYAAVCTHVEPPPGGWPADVCALTRTDRMQLKACLGRGQWPVALRPAAAEFSAEVSALSARRWSAALAGGDAERALWRLLRIGSAPYFVLGEGASCSLRLRIGTAWDWRQHYRLRKVEVTPAEQRGQPVVDWQATVARRRGGGESTVAGHVEVRWSHGKFAQPPEAKVYLDTPHADVPGYWPLT